MSKILVVNNVNFKLNGITKVILNYYWNMDKNGLSFDFLTINNVDDLLKKDLICSGANIFTFDRRKHPFRYIFYLYKLIKKQKYDTIHVHGQSASMAVELWISKILGVKNRIAHSHNTEVSHKFVHYFLYPLFSLSYNKALACSTEAGKWLFRKRNFEVLNNGIFIKKFCFNEEKRKKIRSELSVADNEILLGHVGIFNFQKNQSFLIDIMFKLSKISKKFKLILIGSGEYEKKIKEKAKNLGLDQCIIFAGEKNDVENYYHGMDIFVFPSLFEGLGIVLIEAQASGLPCLVSDAIPNAAKCSDRFYSLSLSSGVNNWIKEILLILKKNIDRKVSFVESIKEKNLDITDEADKLRKIYLRIN